jgi:AcrR family transcriptional regulator
VPDLVGPREKADRSTEQLSRSTASHTLSASPSPSSLTPGKRGPYAKSSQTRERILAAAFEVAGEFGLHQAAVSTIAKRAGVAVGNLHYHFGSRDNLLHELMEWVQRDALQMIEDAMHSAPNVYASLEATVRAHLGYVRRNPAYFRLAEEVRLHRPELYKEGLATWLRLIRESLEAAIAANEIRPMQPDEIASLAHFILGTRYFIDQMIECVDGRPYPGDDAVVATYLSFVQYGLTKRETP